MQVEIQDRDTKRYLQDDLITWGDANTIYATLGTPSGTSTHVVAAADHHRHHKMQITAKTFGTNGSNDPTKAIKKIESFSFDDQTPTTIDHRPVRHPASTTTFTVTGTATTTTASTRSPSASATRNNQLPADDGTASADLQHLPRTPDVVGATSATWSYEVTAAARGRLAVQRHGGRHRRPGRPAQRGPRLDRQLHAVAPTVTISQPVAMTPPSRSPTLIMAPGLAR